MKFIQKFLLVISLSFFISHSNAQTSPIVWSAKWISHPTANLTNFGVYNFRRVFSLTVKPTQFIVNVSADNRYRLFVNGRAVAFGPQRGDLEHWRYETLDIAQYLNEGNNVIAAQVHNEGADKPQAQVTQQTAFILQADTYNQINTGSVGWKVSLNSAYAQISNNDLVWWNWAHGWYAIGGTDNVNGSLYPWGWETINYNDIDWFNPLVISRGQWILEPRQIPMMEEKVEQFPVIARTSGITATSGFLNGGAPLVVLPYTNVSILLDMSYETIGYPELTISRGLNSSIKVTYAEALFDGSNNKGNRNVITGKNIAGYWDIFKSDGGKNRFYRPLWMRTFRYIQFNITTSTDTLFINNYHNVFTAYPFNREATFNSGDATLQKIWDTSWRTMRLCATETNYDCPYYEQLNYEGDTRIQSMIALYTSGDDRLMRDIIRQFTNSVKPNRVLPQGAYPSIWAAPDYFILPVYSLYYIGILHDYFMNRQDDAFIQQYLPTVRNILEEFHTRIDATKMLGKRNNVKDWNFVDWCFPNGTPDGGDNGNSALISLEYLKAMQEAIKMFTYFGNTADVALWQGRADELKLAINTNCYDVVNNVYFETPDKTTYSQHTNILAILTDAVDVRMQKDLMAKILVGKNMTLCTLYYKYYLFRALYKTGMGDQYVGQLDKWKEMLDNGLSTFAEMDNVNTTRSDCHSWSASPGYDFLATIAGIQSAEPGFISVKIAPSFGALPAIHASMPHPYGTISVDLIKDLNDNVTGTIILPRGITGNYMYKSIVIALNEGLNNIPGNFKDTETPTIPTGLKAGTITSNSISLSWNSSTDNVAVSGYEIFINGLSKGSTFTNSFIADNLLPATSYAFSVKAIDTSGNSSVASSVLTATTLSLTDVEEIRNSPFSIYPSPFQNGDLTIKYPLIENGEVSVSILDLVGRIWYRQNVKLWNGKCELTPKLPSGCFIVNINDHNVKMLVNK